MARSNEQSKEPDKQAVVISLPSFFAKTQDNNTTKYLIIFGKRTYIITLPNNRIISPFKQITFKIKEEYELAFKTKLAKKGIIVKKGVKVGTKDFPKNVGKVLFDLNLNLQKNDGIFQMMETNSIDKLEKINILVSIKQNSMYQKEWGIGCTTLIEQKQKENCDEKEETEYNSIPLKIFTKNPKIDGKEYVGHLKGIFVLYQCSLQVNSYGRQLISMLDTLVSSSKLV